MILAEPGLKLREKIALRDKYISRLWLFSAIHRTEAHALYDKLGYDGQRDKGYVKFINEESSK